MAVGFAGVEPCAIVHKVCKGEVLSRQQQVGVSCSYESHYIGWIVLPFTTGQLQPPLAATFNNGLGVATDNRQSIRMHEPAYCFS